MTDKEKILAKIESLLNETNYETFTDEVFGRIQTLKELKSYIDSLQEGSVSKEIGDYNHKAVMESLYPELKEAPVSKDLEIAANEWDAKASFTPFYMALDGNGNPYEIKQDYTTHAESFKAGAKWQKEHLWKPADGDDLPIIDREVIALLDNGKVVFAHRPPEYWDGKSLITGKVEHYTPKTYGKGGWNIPNTVYWLDVEIPKEIEL